MCFKKIMTGGHYWLWLKSNKNYWNIIDFVTKRSYMGFISYLDIQDAISSIEVEWMWNKLNMKIQLIIVFYVSGALHHPAYWTICPTPLWSLNYWTGPLAVLSLNLKRTFKNDVLPQLIFFSIKDTISEEENNLL